MRLFAYVQKREPSQRTNPCFQMLVQHLLQQANAEQLFAGQEQILL